MTGMSRRTILAAPLVVISARLGQSQTAWSPQQPVKFIVPFAAGGSADALCRRIAEVLRKSLGQAVIIENRGGANGVIGLDAVAQSAPDGLTIGMGSVGPISIAPSLIGVQIPYNSQTSFTPIVKLSQQPNVLLAHPSIPTSPVSSFVEWLRANPDQPFGSPGHGSANHLTGIVYAAALGGKLQHVAYRGSAPAQTDVVAGHIKLMVDNIAGNVVPLVRAGQLKAIAVSTAQRSPLLPDVPSMTEAGLPPLPSWQALFAPAGLPSPIVRRYSDELNAALKSPLVGEWLVENGAEAGGGSPEELSEFVNSERRKWASFIQKYNINAS